MSKIRFKTNREARAWILENIQQNDNRYSSGLEDTDPLVYFLRNNAIILEEKQLPEWLGPPREELNKLRGPQKEYKYIVI